MSPWPFLSAILFVANAPAATDSAVFAGGCFWCLEAAFEGTPGVASVTSGYTGGPEANPTYDEVTGGKTGHCEAVKVYFDPGKTTYPKLLDIFWRNIDPTTRDRQFSDSGSQYRTAIFYLNETQRKAALASKAALEKTGPFTQPIVTEIFAAGPFYPAEESQQDYYKKQGGRFRAYEMFSGRAAFLKKTWGARPRK